jgi:hypothetical protein
MHESFHTAVSRRYMLVVPSVTGEKKEEEILSHPRGQTDYGFAFTLPPERNHQGPAVSVHMGAKAQRGPDD